MSEHKKKNLWLKTGLGMGMLVIGVFIASRVIPIIRGPQITIDALPESSEVSDPIISLSGSASDTQKLTLNGSDVLLSPTGSFTQKILLHPGYNTITFDSVDGLGHTKKKSFAFLLKELDTGTFALSSLPNQN